MLKAPKWMREVGWRTVLGGLLLAGVVHIGWVLAVPHLSRGNAYEKLRSNLPLNRMVMFPPPTPNNQPLPFMQPDALYAICRFDIRTNPVTVTAALPGVGWALSLHTPQGDNFYVLPAQVPRRNEVSMMVVQGGERATELVPVPVARRAAANDSQIASPTDEGLIVVRAPLKGLAWRAETEAALRRASCGAAKR
jgi:uncharacterized membrane protein